MPSPSEPPRNPLRRGLIPALVAAVCLISACGTNSGAGARVTDVAAEAASAADERTAAETQPAADAQATEEASAAADAGPPAERLPALSEDEMLEALLTSQELPERPAQHSTYSGVEYFEESLAVNRGVYAAAFGRGGCPSALDEINMDLVGDSPEAGLLHEYTAAAEDGAQQLLYVWMLSYDESVDTSPVWDEVLTVCDEDGISTSAGTIEVTAFDQAPFRGAELRVHGGDSATHGFSATADFGSNLLMISAVNYSAAHFRQTVQRQADKIAAYAAEQQPSQPDAAAGG